MSQNNLTQKFALDQQTGELYELKPEAQADRILAWISVLYLLGTMGFFFWLMFDVWIGQKSLAILLGYRNTAPMDSPLFRLIAYVFIGGALGGSVDGVRSFLKWHAEKAAFGGRFIWRYITAPWLGAALALFTFALIRGGVAVFSGESASTTTTLSQSLATFSVGVLAGYGSRNVFIWLDAQVGRIFRVPPADLPAITVPELTGRTLQEAEKILTVAHLKLGVVSKEVQRDPALVGKVIRQTPLPGLVIPAGEAVNLTIGESK